MSQAHRPLVTFALLLYNQQEYAAAAIEAALQQDYSLLEILISDDCSQDRTFEIARDTVANYRGPHVLRLSRNPANLGLIGHVNHIFSIARGEIIVAAAGDDLSYPGRVSRLVEVMQASRALLAHSAVDRIDENGSSLGTAVPPIIEKSLGLAEAARAVALYIGASGAWHRTLYDRWGPIRYRHAYEDLVLGFRAIAAGSIAYVAEPLLKYRVGSGLSTQRTAPQNVAEVRRNRLALIRVHSAVFRQRLRDLRKHGADRALRNSVYCAYRAERLRCDFYSRPQAFCAAVFWRFETVGMRVLWQEARHIGKSLALICHRHAAGALRQLVSGRSAAGREQS